MHDVVVVGAGPAGCSVALLLARRGYRVLVLERNALTPDSVAVHTLSPAAVVLLERWGLLDQLLATGCPAAGRTTVWVGADRLDLPNPPDSPLSYAPRRTALVSLLSAAAVDAGAHVRTGFTAKDVVWENERVAGVVGTGDDCRSVYERSRMVVAADGRNSLVARIVDVESYEEHPATNCCYHACWRGPAGPVPEVFLGERRMVAVHPTDGGLAWIVAARPVTDWVEYKRAPEATYLDQIGLFSPLAGRFAAATRESRLGGTADLGSSLRVPWGAGWALVGEAGHPHDGSLCLGTPDVFTEARMLTSAIDEGLSGRRPLGDALGGYHQARDAHVLEPHGVLGALAYYQWTVDDVADVLARAQAARVSELARVIAAPP